MSVILDGVVQSDLPAQIAGAIITFTVTTGPSGAPTRAVWTNMPNPVTEFLGLNGEHRAIAELASAAQARLVVDLQTVGAATGRLAVQYWDGAAWQYLDGVSGPFVQIATINGVPPNVGAWVNLTPAARTGDRIVRLVGSGGDGVADPQFGLILLEFR